MADKESQNGVPTIRTFAEDFAAAEARVVQPPKKPDTPAVDIPAEPAESAAERPSTEEEDTFVAIEDGMHGTIAERSIEVTEDTVEDGEIISAKRTRRTRLLPAIGQALWGWAKETTDELTEDDRPVIQDPQKRTDTITAATASSALPENEDFSTVAARVADEEVVEANTSIEVTDTADLPAPQWSSTLEPAEPVSATSPAPEPEPTAPVVEEVLPAPIETTTPPVAETPSEPAAPEPEPPAPVVTPPAVAPEPPVAPSVEPTAPASIAEDLPTAEATSRYQYRDTPPIISSQGQYIIVLVSIGAIVAGVILTIWLFSFFRQPDQFLAPTVPSAITVDSTEAIAFTNDAATILGSLTQTMNTGSQGVTQLYFITQYDTETSQVTGATEFFSVVPLQASGSFIRNITALTFGSVDGTTPFVIMSVESFETAFGGILAWEDSIVTDLAPFLGTSPTAAFLDTTSNNRDIRVAERVDGSELLYTFLDRNTLLITTDRAVLGEIIPRLPN